MRGRARGRGGGGCRAGARDTWREVAVDRSARANGRVLRANCGRAGGGRAAVISLRAPPAFLADPRCAVCRTLARVDRGVFSG